MRIAALDDETQARALAEQQAGEWQVVEREERIEEDAPPLPYTTADLLEDAALKLGWSAEKTMQTAQTLFEQGWITYPRTDSVQVAAEAVQAARQVVAERYGAEMLGKSFPQAETDGAHEAIRPADVRRSPEEVQTAEGQLLYRLIWSRFLAAQMRPARIQVVTLTLEKEG
jgi:DNA topoisomerase-1